jgi:hypothetical protein
LEEQIAKLMKNLDLTREEALEVIASDKAIEKGEKLFELTTEQKKAEKQARTTTSTKSKVDAYGKKSAREKKVNNEKLELIEILQKALAENSCQVTLTTNPEREFEFTKGNTKYKIVMSVPRK